MTDNPYSVSQTRTTDRPTRMRFAVVSMLTLAAAISYLTRSSVSVAESTIRQDLGLSLRESGWIMGSFFWSYAVLQVPAGWLAFRYGTRWAMTLFAVVWSAGAVCIGTAQGLVLLIAAQLLMGAAQAGTFPASCHSISHWVPLSGRTLACGILATGMQAGAILSGLITGALILALNWRPVFVLYALPGFVWAAWFWWWFCNRPEKDARVSADERALISAGRLQTDSGSDVPRTTPWLAILTSPAVWFLCGQQICRASGYMFFASWFPTYLQRTRGVSIEQSGYLQALVFCGTLTGSLCGGLLTDWIFRRTGNLRRSRSGVGTVFLTGCGLLILTAWFVDQAIPAVALLTLGAFFAALAGPCAFSATIDIGGDHVPQVFGLMNMMGNLAAAATPILVAELFELSENWNLVLLAFAIVYFVGAASWSRVNCEQRVS